MIVTFAELEKIDNSLSMEAIKTYIVKSKYGEAQKYAIRIKNKNTTFETTFTDSIHNTQNRKKLNLADVFYCVLSDANCYESCIDFQDFCLNFGYDDMSKLNDTYRIYQACKNTSENLKKMFTSSQIEQLQTLFQDY